jgi:hypothetical protein
MKGDSAYKFIIFLLIFTTIELLIAIANQFYVPNNKKYEDLQPLQQILYKLRLYLNTIEAFLIIYLFAVYGQYLNILTIILFVAIFLAIIRYFLFARKWIYYFVEKNESNSKIFDFIEGKFGVFQNAGIVILLIYIIARIFLFKIY